VRIDSKGNPIFTQKRVGKDGKIFIIYKIRTLYLEHFGIFPDQNEPSDYRITRLGKYLRRSKLDELPQLLNIVLGQMSFVGPRPMAYDYVKIVGIRIERLAVKPGLTGITQVSGNLQLSWDDRILLDILYVNNCSILLDFKILIATVFALIHGERVDKDYLKLRSQLTDKNKTNCEKPASVFQLSQQ
jgi:lipopolysaccharide/colanic/teichoic acid biosynthesis glycosyltransferase